jgi:nicotinamidase-related amidase
LGACAATALTTMRLPADAVLLVIDAQEAIDDPRHGSGDVPQADHNIAALIAAWRAEGLPLAHVGRQPTASAARRALAIRPLDGEIVIVRHATSAFVRADLEARLDELGATTLVLCGTLATHALEASARHAGDLGYQVFVVADACRAADALDLRGRLWPAEDVWALSVGAHAGASQGRGRDYRRCRDGASSRGDGEGAPATRRRKDLTVPSKFNAATSVQFCTRCNLFSGLGLFFCN